jgi:nitroreductase
MQRRKQMGFFELAQSRFSVRQMRPDRVPAGTRDQILEAARIAPTAGNRQPQRILVVEDEAGFQKIDAATACRFGAQLVFVVCYDKNEAWVRPFDGQDSGYVDASIVTTHMMLQAADLGLGTTWVMHFDPKAIVEGFGLPDGLVPVAVLPTGYPADEAAPSPKHGSRKEIGELTI